MTELERQLTEALKTLSVQYERAQRRHSGQIEALQEYVEVLREYVEALRQHAERQSGESEALRTRIEWLDGQVKRLAESYGTLAATL
jgi:chromosome segregation ATPase